MNYAIPAKAIGSIHEICRQRPRIIRTDLSKVASFALPRRTLKSDTLTRQCKCIAYGPLQHVACKSDAYATFKEMLDDSNPPDDFDSLMKEALATADRFEKEWKLAPIG